MTHDSTQSLRVPKRMNGMRLDRALAELLPERTRSQLQKLVRKGSLKLDGRKVLRSNFNLKGGEQLTYCLDGGLPSDRLDEPLRFLYEEASFAVVSKPPGMLTHPTERQEGGTLADHLVERFGPLPSRDDAYRPGIVHRLDRETSGLLVVARTQEALDRLQDQFRKRSVHKSYLAAVHGIPERDHFQVDLALGTVAGQRDLQGPMQDGRSAHTEFSVLRKWREFSLVQCRPSTGRRHQLRVHLWSEGHPIAGDKLYRTIDKNDRVQGLRYHALHCEALGFAHPESGEALSFKAPLFPDFEKFLAGLGA